MDDTSLPESGREGWTATFPLSRNTCNQPGQARPLELLARIHVEKHGTQEFHMRPLLLWLVGIPIPIIILLYVFGVLH
jgi:hypothetical protein